MLSETDTMFNTIQPMYEIYKSKISSYLFSVVQLFICLMFKILIGLFLQRQSIHGGRQQMVDAGTLYEPCLFERCGETMN